MWMVDPMIMCRQHLLGEHVELHMLVGTLKRGISVRGYLRDKLFEPESLYQRHEDLVNEMEWRGYNHKSPLDVVPLDHLPDNPIDRMASLAELIRRCPECQARYHDLQADDGLLTGLAPLEPRVVSFEL
jgi:hypothetical protein